MELLDAKTKRSIFDYGTNMNIKLISCSIFSMFAMCVFADTTLNSDVYQDNNNDLDTQQYCKSGLSTDVNAVELSSAAISNDDQNLYVALRTNGNVFEGSSYKEYYLWVDIDPKSKIGYVPYFSDPTIDLNNLSEFRIGQYQAWDKFYADYRVFVSNKEAYAIDKGEGQDQYQDYLYLFQTCNKSNCSKIDSVTDAFSNNFGLDIYKKRITFTIPLEKIKVSLGSTIEVGITTYYKNSSYGTCNGEDDLPNWGSDAISYTLNLED